MRIYLRAFSYLKPYIWHFIGSLILVAIFTASNIFFLPLTRDIINELSTKSMDRINNQIINAILLYATRLIAQNGQTYVMTSLSNLMLIDIRTELYSHLQRLSQHFFGGQKLGDLLTRLFDDTSRVKEVLINCFAEALPQICTFIGVITYMCILNWKLTVFSLITIPLFIIIISFAAEKIKKATVQIQKKVADISHIAQETLSNIKAVQSNTMEQYETTKFFEESRRSYRSTMASVAIRCKTEPLISFLQFAVIGAVVWYGSYEMARGRMTSADLASFFTGILLLIDPVLALSKIYNNLQQGLVSVQRIYEVLDTPNPIQSPASPTPLTTITGTVRFHNVSFWYSTPQKPALKNISLTANSGEIIALVGPSGAGKSTLINLIPRFYDPTEGHISLDGIPLQNLDVLTLRQNIGIVPQDDVLFRGSILDNVRYGKIEATEEAVIHALHMANAWEFVALLPSGIYTKIGDKGRKLSGGQKQRLSIARAILRNPKILILDEATSALDTRSEKLVQEALEKLMTNRTTFVIAHRLSTVRHAHQILVMEDGQIKETGTHTSLLAQGGIYEKLYHLQFEKN